ncbi:MAG: transglutaminase domain-containing protein [Alphaproteobacteria bacterium]|nr:transglutaminase domain-containing protein [Alphaproteobacteria bacterium]
MARILMLLWCVFIGCAAQAAGYGAEDARARTTPPGRADTLENLVAYLVESYRDDEQKARVLLAWIVHHVDYDQYKAGEIEKRSKSAMRPDRTADTGDAFETRVGVCGDIADLYRRMVALAGMEGAVVTGYAGDHVTARNKEQHRHVWNAVKIKGKWELVDPTWAMGRARVFQNVRGRTAHESAIQNRMRNAHRTEKTRRGRSVDDAWFMTKPSRMIRTHYPDEERWQLLPVPKSPGAFLK